MNNVWEPSHIITTTNIKRQLNSVINHILNVKATTRLQQIPTMI